MPSNVRGSGQGSEAYCAGQGEAKQDTGRREQRRSYRGPGLCMTPTSDATKSTLDDDGDDEYDAAGATGVLLVGCASSRDGDGHEEHGGDDSAAISVSVEPPLLWHTDWAAWKIYLAEYCERTKQVLPVKETLSRPERIKRLKCTKKGKEVSMKENDDSLLLPEAFDPYQRTYICTHGAKRARIYDYLLEHDQNVIQVDVDNMVREHKSSVSSVDDNEATAREVATFAAADPENVASIADTDAGETGVISLASAHMRRVYGRFSEVLLVDCSHKTNRYNYQLLTFMAMNEFSEGAVVQQSLLEANGDWHMEKAIAHFKRAHPTRINLVRVIVVDKDLNEIHRKLEKVRQFSYEKFKDANSGRREQRVKTHAERYREAVRVTHLIATEMADIDDESEFEEMLQFVLNQWRNPTNRDVHNLVHRLKKRENALGRTTSAQRLKVWMAEFGEEDGNVGRIFIDRSGEKFHVLKYLREEIGSADYGLNSWQREQLRCTMSLLVYARTELEYEKYRRYMRYLLKIGRCTVAAALPATTSTSTDGQSESTGLAQNRSRDAALEDVLDDQDVVSDEHMQRSANAVDDSCTHPFEEYFKRNWDNCRELWCAYKRQNCVTLGNNTNNRLELSWKQLKDWVDSFMELDECIASIMYYQSLQEKSFLSRVFKVSTVHNPEYDREMSVVANSVSEHACKQIFTQYQNESKEEDALDEPRAEYSVNKRKWECSYDNVLCEPEVPWDSNRKYREAKAVANDICDTLAGLGMPQYRTAMLALRQVADLFETHDFEQLATRDPSTPTASDREKSTEVASCIALGNQRESGIETGPEDESGTPSVAEVDSGNVACIKAESGIETGAGGKSRSPPVTEVESGIGTGAGVESGI
ncbi:hypothetical protein PHYSODRAFT_342274 [Phytophthora sojae]|uniref:ZSWIM1/3 RNaseH-like domain-containing protein n=1 Tax=Phytophthora sojae (strain P6497) TaxID=1094619 RepID=G5AFR8_PHYSP|nr:hypothetical protein PHYSODRAFT_342274 [Phytophthora sojae]EGZ05434.1 hypothetical protein PHYSODRAFT_342274 [Phytophthora sojae]|eukprot:XP_009538965.1 hypothetical protein PHYSODRAFT_342274 [Phytophthora sojae]